MPIHTLLLLALRDPGQPPRNARSRSGGPPRCTCDGDTAYMQWGELRERVSPAAVTPGNGSWRSDVEGREGSLSMRSSLELIPCSLYDTAIDDDAYELMRALEQLSMCSH